MDSLVPHWATAPEAFLESPWVVLSGMRLLALCWVSFRDYGGCLGVPHCIFLSVSVRLCLVIYIPKRGSIWTRKIGKMYFGLTLF